jgi:hypothetical protein
MVEAVGGRRDAGGLGALDEVEVNLGYRESGRKEREGKEADVSGTIRAELARPSTSRRTGHVWQE